MTLPPALTSYITTTLPKMNGWCSPEKATALAEAVLDERPKLCIEIGVFAGRSLFAIALALKANTYGRVIGIDPWLAAASTAGFEHDPANRDWWGGKVDHEAIYKECHDLRFFLGVDFYCDLYRGTSEQFYQASSAFTYYDNPVKPVIDLLHIDGNHSEASALYDVNHYVPLVRPGGIVAFDDLSWATTKPAQKRLAELCTLERTVTDCGFYRRL